ncbi:MAG: hypothetical protein H8E72_06370 [Candidatus Marinimicrobia bacterium]|nr:hypothetical protein [Candidatus Neomarinimicrobiota bacterium]
MLLLLNCLWPAFELPSKVNSLFPHSYSENPEISFTTYQPFGQSYLHTSQLQYSTHIKDYVWHSDVIFTGDSLYAELSSTHWAGIKWTPNAIVSFGISYHELDITNFNKMSTFSTSFHLLLKVNKFSNMAVKGSHLYQSNKVFQMPQSISVQYLWQNAQHANFNYEIKKEVGFPSAHNLFSTYPLLDDKFYIRIGYLSGSSEIFFSSIIEFSKLSAQPFFLFHPQLGQSLGMQINIH